MRFDWCRIGGALPPPLWGRVGEGGPQRQSLVWLPPPRKGEGSRACSRVHSIQPHFIAL